MRTKAKLMSLRYPGIRILIVRRTYPELINNHINILRAELLDIARYNDKDKVLKFANGSTINFAYCAKDTDLDRLQGVEYDIIFLDEATQLSEYQMKTITACLRGVNDFPKRVYYTCNPGGQGHQYIKRIFIDKRYESGEDPEEYTFIQSLVTDNKVLLDSQPDYIKQLEALPPKLKEAWLYGRWDIFEGQFFEDFADRPEQYAERAYTHVIDPFEIPEGWKIYRSFDWGYNKPFSCGWWAVDYRPSAYEEWDVQSALYDALDHADKGQDNLIRIGNMPKFIVDLLGIDGDFYIYRNHAYDNMVTETQAKEDGRFSAKSHYHGLGVDTMTDAIMSLENPMMTISTKTNDGNPTVIMLLPVEGKNKTPLYAVLSFYSSKDINGDYSRKPHVVLTIAERNFIEVGGRAGIADIINGAVSDGRVISFDEKMRDYLTVNTKATSLGIISEQSLSTNLARFLKEIKSFREINHINYKLPGSDGESSRELLADAFDELVQTPKERELMDQYRANITKVEEVQDRLQKLRGKIRELTKAKGDKAKIAALNKTAADLADLIDKYDRKLLGLEASKPLRDVLKRAQAAEKLDSDKLMAEYRKQVQERFDSGVEGRRKTAMRHKIQNVVGELNRLLLTNDKKRHVPDNLKKAVADALSLVNMDTVGAEERAAKYCKALGFDPAVVAPEPVITGMAQVTQPTKIDGGYRIEGVDFVIDTARAYDCYIRDLGAAGEPEERSNMVLVAGVKPWELEQTMQAVRGGRGRDMTVMLSFATRRDRDALRPLFGSNAVEMAPWMPDPWHPTNEQLAVYDRLLRNKMLSICKEERNYAL